MPKFKVAVVGVGKTAQHIVGTTLSNSDMLKKDVEIYLLDTKETKPGEPERKKAELLAEEFRNSGRALGKEYSVYSGPENIRRPDITIITTGRPRLPGESRSNMSKDNSVPIKNFITDYCHRHEISLEYSDIINLVNSVAGLTPYIFELMKEEYGESAKPDNIFSSGTGLDFSRLDGTMRKFIEADLALGKNRSNSIIKGVGMVGGHDDTMVPCLDNCTVGGKPIKEVLGEDNVARICNEVRKMGAEYNKHCDGAGPSVGADVFRNLIMPIVNDSLENVPVLAPLKIDNNYELSCLGLDRNNILAYAADMAGNSKAVRPEDVEEIPFKYIWTGLLPKVGRKGVAEPGVPDLSYKEKGEFEYSIAGTIMENLEACREGGILRPYMNYNIRRPVLASA